MLELSQPKQKYVLLLGATRVTHYLDSVLLIPWWEIQMWVAYFACIFLKTHWCQNYCFSKQGQVYKYLCRKEHLLPSDNNFPSWSHSKNLEAYSLNQHNKISRKCIYLNHLLDCFSFKSVSNNILADLNILNSGFQI